MISKETIKRALWRFLEGGLLGAAMAFVVIPVDLGEPKRYLLALSVGLPVGFLMGVKKAVKGYCLYDAGKKKEE